MNLASTYRHGEWPVGLAHFIERSSNRFPTLSGTRSIRRVEDETYSGLTPTEWHERMIESLTSRMLEGRWVLRTNGHSLGFILGVNDIAREVQVETPGDRPITLPESELRAEGDNVYASDSGHLAMK